MREFGSVANSAGVAAYNTTKRSCRKPGRAGGLLPSLRNLNSALAASQSGFETWMQTRKEGVNLLNQLTHVFRSRAVPVIVNGEFPWPRNKTQLIFLKSSPRILALTRPTSRPCSPDGKAIHRWWTSHGDPILKNLSDRTAPPPVRRSNRSRPRNPRVMERLPSLRKLHPPNQ